MTQRDIVLKTGNIPSDKKALFHQMTFYIEENILLLKKDLFNSQFIIRIFIFLEMKINNKFFTFILLMKIFIRCLMVDAKASV